jgi:hypothetical protein
VAEHFHADEGIHLNHSLQESIDAILPGLSKAGRQIEPMRRRRMKARSAKAHLPGKVGFGGVARCCVLLRVSAGISRHGVSRHPLADAARLDPDA